MGQGPPSSRRRRLEPTNRRDERDEQEETPKTDCGGWGARGGSRAGCLRRRQWDRGREQLRQRDDREVPAAAQGDLTISNWPLYVDKNTVSNFDAATGVHTTYIEDVNDNQEFFAKMQPLLSKGQSGGRSIIVVTDWMAEKMHDLGYVQNLDKAGIPNVEANLRDNLRHVTTDPNRDFSVPWQSGMTGLIVNTKLAPNVRSINDLFDPQYKGKVEMLTELRDTVPLVMKAGRDRSHDCHRARLARHDRQAQAGGLVRSDSSLHRERLQPATWRMATSRQSSAVGRRGAASRRTTRTSSSACPPRGASSGRTTWRSRSGRPIRPPPRRS